MDNNNENILKNIYVVVGSGISDLGKGWTTSAIGGLFPQKTVPVKIDPLLNLCFPEDIGVEIGQLCGPEDVQQFMAQGRAASPSFKISEDMLLYKSVGMSIYPECNIVAGDLMRRFLLEENRPNYLGGVRKRTFNDVSAYLARELTNIAKSRKAENLLIEIGGTIADAEHLYIPGALRLLSYKEYLGVTPEIILLTFFDYTEVDIPDFYRVKTRFIKQALLDLRRLYYGIPMRACVVRRRGVPPNVSDDQLKQDLKNIAYENQVSPEKLLYFPNINKNQIGTLTEILRKSGLFKE